jgi:glutathione synthase/RimK-type ligase-like ATP-grasp enzyme
MIWIKIKNHDSAEETIYLPQNLADKIPKQVKVQFGLKSMEVKVQPLEDIYTPVKSTFHNPIKIQFSQEVIKRLLIRETLVYQLIYKEDILHIGPVIGFLLGEQSYYYHDRNMQGLTRGMGIYSEIGGLFMAFKDISIDWGNMLINGLFYENDTKQWGYGSMPLPSVVFRRAFYTSQRVVDELKRLTGNKVFNSTRFDKWEVHKMLEKNTSFKKYLPETAELLALELWHNFIEKYKKVILKPAGLSRGRGICFIHVMEDQFAIYDYRASDLPRFYILKSDEIDEYIINNFIDKNYVIQEQLDLATINGAPFDIRIVMGKNEDKSWHCRGIECRKAGPKNKITNISRGGQALSINNAIRLSFGPRVDSNKVKKEIISIAEEFCIFMDQSGEHFAEFGLDLAIDPQQRYWFIEANVRPVFRGFRDMDYGNYLHIRHMPLLYAASLAGFGKEAPDSESKI